MSYFFFLSRAENALEGRIIPHWTCSPGEDSRNSKPYFWFWPSWLFSKIRDQDWVKQELAGLKAQMGCKYSFAEGTSSLSLCSENTRGTSTHLGLRQDRTLTVVTFDFWNRKSTRFWRNSLQETLQQLLLQQPPDWLLKAICEPQTHNIRSQTAQTCDPKSNLLCNFHSLCDWGGQGRMRVFWKPWKDRVHWRRALPPANLARI